MKSEKEIREEIESLLKAEKEVAKDMEELLNSEEGRINMLDIYIQKANYIQCRRQGLEWVLS